MRHALAWVMGAVLACQVQALADGIEGAAWRVSGESTQGDGIRVLSGADGEIAFVSRGGKPCLGDKDGATPSAVYLYFDMDDARAQGVETDVYATVEYFDATPGGVIQIEYDSATGEDQSARYMPNEDQWGGWFIGDKRWKTAVFLLKKPGFRNRQNLGADFRLGGAPLFVRSVALSHNRPPRCDEPETEQTARLKQRVKIGKGGQFIIGGFDPARAEDVARQTRALRAALPALKSIGVTSHEGYVRWNLCEPEQGRYDWSVYDAFVDLYKRYDMKWVPFLIVGSAYSLPDWYYKQPGSQGYVCLEHGEESDVQSLWNPVLRGHVARFVQAFCDHYRDTGVIESILLGVTGNYGEAIYVATGNDWTADIHGNYHCHSGFWAGDPYAVQDFREHMARKYGDIATLDKAWGATLVSFDDVKPFLRDQAPNDRAWIDFCTWYIGAMTEWSSFWMQETRKHFPKGDIYLCTGGHAPAEHGADFGDQCKLAAEIGGGVRITNEGSDYRANFSLTRWVASAGRQYGAYYSFEPAGAVNTEGVVARIYGASVSGARGLHYYYPNLFAGEAPLEAFERWGHEFKQRKPAIEIAVYYPETYILLNGNQFLGKLQPLRDRFDFDYMSDHQILDGGLKTIRALVLLEGNVSESEVWKSINAWVREGGLLLYADGIGKLRTVEGDESVHDALIGSGADHGRGRVAIFSGDPETEAYRQFLADCLAKAPELSHDARKMVALDGHEDGIFAALCERHRLVWLNYTPQIAFKGGHQIAPYSIATQNVRARTP